MNNNIKHTVIFLFTLFSLSVSSKENVNWTASTSVVNTRVAAGCSASNSKTDLDVNNIRTTIMGGGDMWWNLDDARYEIPKDGDKHSLFAGALWIGGVDDGGQLKVAAMTYRQGGNDFWPGPLVLSTASTSEEHCSEWDQHFKLNRSDVEEFVARFGEPGYVVPKSIQDWPAHEKFEGEDHYLAPFHDVDGDGEYSWEAGDYPDYNISGTDADARLFGDQTLFWIFNDKGNIHTESEADALGLEIHAQAFGFVADNEVNDMTFYNYKIFNRSTTPLNNTYFGQWVDPDLGTYDDDYVGCDVALGLGFCYNGDAEDEGANGYGFNPPAIGVDFFQGPYSDVGDGKDNDRDGFIDEIDTIVDALGVETYLTEQIIMSKFMYFNNDPSVTGNPGSGADFYNYLRGIWKDNVPMTFGGDGHGAGVGSTTEECDFMFPGVSDASFPNQEWTEQTADNLPADRRFVQSAGPFTLLPGAVNEITTGVVWARAKSGGQTASVQLLKIYDREAQALFDNNFNILNGPDAPDLEIRELNQELIITLYNSATSNNIDESYFEKDPYITKPANLDIDGVDNILGTSDDGSPNYNFQGYLVYQLSDATVSVTDLNDPDKARMVFRSDIKDNVTGIVNQYLDPILGVYTPIEEVPSVLSSGVKGSIDEGVEYSFQITDDKFALGSPRLVNHKTYYFMSIAYGYNMAEENSSPYDVSAVDYDGRNQPFISGRRNIQVYSAIPHYTEGENNGTVLNSVYGDGVEIIRVEGTGNGGGYLDFSDETIDDILGSELKRSLYPVYKQGMGPISFEVVDPMQIPAGDFLLKFKSPVYNSNASGDQTALNESFGSWVLTNETTGEVVANMQKDLLLGTEKYVTELGFNIKITQASAPGAKDADGILLSESNGFISGEIEHENNDDRWLTGLADRDPVFPNAYGLNWIRSGSYVDEGDNLQSDYNQSDDPGGIYEGAVIESNNVFNGIIESSGGTWAPYCFASDFNDGPGFKLGGMHSYTMSEISDLNSVDIIFTDDKSKWTRSCVVEAQDNEALSEGNKLKMELRSAPSVDKDGMPDTTGTTGMGWFPGYAVDLETGERLNIIFAEDSWQKDPGLNGNDMKWNPTSEIATDGFDYAFNQVTSSVELTGGDYLLGGKHFIYVIKGEAWVKGTEEYLSDPISKDKYCPNYDEGKWIYNQLTTANNAAGRWNVFKNCTWVGVPLLVPGKELFACDVTVKLRVSKPFKQYETVSSDSFYNSDDTLNVGETYTVAYMNGIQTWGGKKVQFSRQCIEGVDSALVNVYESNVFIGQVVELCDETFDSTYTYLPGNTFTFGAWIDDNSGDAILSFTGSSKARLINANAVNGFNPVYRFSTDGIVTLTGDINTAQDAMDNIKAVPNPYYSYSSYENNQLDNRVKITNLPQIATISIFSVSGTLVRTLNKDDSMSFIDWDLKNNFNIPIASGLYIIHVRGKFWDSASSSWTEKEKIIKWFGALRPIDLDTF
jgi:hypothetical protein